MLDIALNALPVNEEAVEQVCDLAENSDLPADVKQGFSQRRLEFLEDFSCSIQKIRRAQEAHAKTYKNKTGTALAIGKRRTTDDRWACVVWPNCNPFILGIGIQDGSFATYSICPRCSAHYFISWLKVKYWTSLNVMVCNIWHSVQ